MTICHHCDFCRKETHLEFVEQFWICRGCMDWLLDDEKHLEIKEAAEQEYDASIAHSEAFR